MYQKGFWQSLDSEEGWILIVMIIIGILGLGIFLKGFWLDYPEGMISQFVVGSLCMILSVVYVCSKVKKYKRRYRFER